MLKILSLFCYLDNETNGSLPYYRDLVRIV